VLFVGGHANVARYSWHPTFDELFDLYRRAADDRPPPRATAPDAPALGALDRLLDRAIELVPDRLAERHRPMVQLASAPPGRQGGDPAAPTIVRVVVLDYNGGPFVVRCVDALRRTEVPAGLTLEIVVIDNASSDASADAVAAAHPDVLVLRNTENAGFPANNLGLWDLDGVAAVGLINSDAFVEPDWLAPLLDSLEADEGRGAVCPRILLDARFIDVVVSSATFTPGGADTRALGVRVLGLRIGGDGAGDDVWAGTRVALDDFGREHGPEGIFQWTGAQTLFRVPVPSSRVGPVSASLLLASPTGRSVTATVVSGSATVTVELAGPPVWVDIPLDGAPYDLVNNAGSIVFDDGYGADRGFLEPDGPAFDEPVDVFAFCGGAVLFRPAFLRDVGVLDRRFFLYYEDTDLSWRGRSRGWTYRYVPASRVRHLHAASAVEGSTFSTYFNERNRLMMLMKNAPAPMVVDALRGTAQVIGTDVRQVVERVAARRRFDRLDRSHLRHAWVRSRSLGGFLRHLPFMARRRRQIARDRLVDEAELLAGLTPRGV
jgi:GT2 family glycosyltransferase